MTDAGVAPGVGVVGTTVGSAIGVLVGAAIMAVAAGVGVTGGGVSVAPARLVGFVAVVPVVAVGDGPAVATWAALPEQADNSRAAGAPPNKRNASRRGNLLVTSFLPHRIPAAAGAIVPARIFRFVKGRRQTSQ
jgi:hypothetical protein